MAGGSRRRAIEDHVIDFGQGKAGLERFMAWSRAKPGKGEVADVARTQNEQLEWKDIECEASKRRIPVVALLREAIASRPKGQAPSARRAANEPAWPAWREFRERYRITRFERRMLMSIILPEGQDPTLAFYQGMLLALQYLLTEPVRQRPRWVTHGAAGDGRPSWTRARSVGKQKPRGVMGRKKLKTEHAGAKNGGGAYGKRAEVKDDARRRRRAVDRQAVQSAGEPIAAAARYTAVFTPDAGNSWNAALVEKPNGCEVATSGKSIAQARKRLREALEMALDDEDAASRAKLVERFELPEAKKLASVRARREQLELSWREVTREASELARTLRAQGFRPRDVEELLGRPDLEERGPSRASLRKIPPLDPSKSIHFGRGPEGLKRVLAWSRAHKKRAPDQ